MYGYSEETGHVDPGFNETFNSKSLRQGFIRKVYGILSVQLLVSLGFVLAFSSSESLSSFALGRPWLIFICFIVNLATLIPMICSQDLRRRTPHNFILLAIFTLSEAMILGFLSSVSKPEVVLMAVGITALIFVSLTIFAFQTKIDFTMFNGIMFVAVMCLMLLGIFSMIFPNKILSVVYSSLGAFIFSVYIIIDTQMIVKQESKYHISIEEYIFASLILYLDVINVFIYILNLLNDS